MEEFEIVRERVVKTEINEDSSDNREDNGWSSIDLISSSCDSPSPTKAIKKKDAVHSKGKGRTRPGKSKAKQPRRSSDESSDASSASEEPKRLREKPHRCLSCAKTFRKRRTLDSHMLTHLRTKTYECHACRRSFDCKQMLRRHACPVAVDEPFRFTLRRKGYSRKGNLVTQAVDKSDVKFGCAVCGLACSDKGALKTHKRVHTGEKPYECYVCDKAFAIKASLNAHARTHTGEKPFQCTVCQKSFRRRFHLLRHVVTHTRERSRRVREKLCQ